MENMVFIFINLEISQKGAQRQDLTIIRPIKIMEDLLAKLDILEI